MIAPAARTGAWRHVWLTLAALAVALKVLIPAGFMPAFSPDAKFPLVLCTGHGAVTLDSAQATGKKPPPDKPAHDAPCAFAGHGVAAPAPDVLPTGFVEVVFEPAATLQPPRQGPAPGRGLAAPPPPPRGPPLLLI